MIRHRLHSGHIVLLDECDAHLLTSQSWHVYNANASHLYVVSGKKSTRQLMHRVIMNPSDGLHVDHVNGNGLDNRRGNLRVCTHSQNMRNRHLHKNNTSGHAGVRYVTASGRWRAIIWFNSKMINLGFFASKAEAIAARKAAEPIYFGEFAPSHLGERLLR